MPILRTAFSFSTAPTQPLSHPRSQKLNANGSSFPERGESDNPDVGDDGEKNMELSQDDLPLKYSTRGAWRWLVRIKAHIEGKAEHDNHHLLLARKSNSVRYSPMTKGWLYFEEEDWYLPSHHRICSADVMRLLSMIEAEEQR